MSAITTKFEELSQYAPEILELLTTGVLKIDKEKRCQARDHLQKDISLTKNRG
ncbi:4749_t:CDS:2 [Diversispora eburnea]|uniref:4749_t:CDS:1 n=1 Tax=Diversispora eburnea TaxID=1213867 RepID=A0A9N9FIF0_9GLOM|nr:4749_t:CDS:2 [Diversispora eburnea]